MSVWREPNANVIEWLNEIGDGCRLTTLCDDGRRITLMAFDVACPGTSGDPIYALGDPATFLDQPFFRAIGIDVARSSHARPLRAMIACIEEAGSRCDTNPLRDLAGPRVLTTLTRHMVDRLGNPDAFDVVVVPDDLIGSGREASNDDVGLRMIATRQLLLAPEGAADAAITRLDDNLKPTAGTLRALRPVEDRLFIARTEALLADHIVRNHDPDWLVSGERRSIDVEVFDHGANHHEGSRRATLEIGPNDWHLSLDVEDEPLEGEHWVVQHDPPRVLVDGQQPNDPGVELDVARGAAFAAVFGAGRSAEVRAEADLGDRSPAPVTQQVPDEGKTASGNDGNGAEQTHTPACATRRASTEPTPTPVERHDGEETTAPASDKRTASEEAAVSVENRGADEDSARDRRVAREAAEAVGAPVAWIDATAAWMGRGPDAFGSHFVYAEIKRLRDPGMLVPLAAQFVERWRRHDPGPLPPSPPPEVFDDDGLRDVVMAAFDAVDAPPVAPEGASGTPSGVGDGHDGGPSNSDEADGDDDADDEAGGIDDGTGRGVDVGHVALVPPSAIARGDAAAGPDRSALAELVADRVGAVPTTSLEAVTDDHAWATVDPATLHDALVIDARVHAARLCQAHGSDPSNKVIEEWADQIVEELQGRLVAHPALDRASTHRRHRMAARLAEAVIAVLHADPGARHARRGRIPGPVFDALDWDAVLRPDEDEEVGPDGRARLRLAHRLDTWADALRATAQTAQHDDGQMRVRVVLLTSALVEAAIDDEAQGRTPDDATGDERLPEHPPLERLGLPQTWWRTTPLTLLHRARAALRFDRDARALAWEVRDPEMRRAVRDAWLDTIKRGPPKPLTEEMLAMLAQQVRRRSDAHAGAGATDQSERRR